MPEPNQFQRLIDYHAANPHVAVRVQVNRYLPDPQSAIMLFPTKHSLDLMVLVLCAPHLAGMVLTFLPFAKPFNVNERLPHNPEYENIVGAYVRYRR